MRLDFFARRAHYIDHMAPVYRALPEDLRGAFTVSTELYDYARQEIGEGEIEIYDERTPHGTDPILVASYGDIFRAARRLDRKIVHIEHGTGHAFGKAAYPNSRKGHRDLVNLFLAPNEYTAQLIRSVRSTPVEVIGTPKLDPFAEYGRAGFQVQIARPKQLVIAIGFHWGDRRANPPESGSAWEHYKEILPALHETYRVIGHGHPLAADVYRAEFEKVGIEWVPDFRDVMRRASIYINDLSSTLYEFLVTGKPVIVLNAPWFRRDVHWGIRFWDYSNVGINVEGPQDLMGAIDRTWEEYSSIHLLERAAAVRDLYPYLGASATRAAQVLTSYLEGL